MSDEERVSDSLADQAAAWVPPWARRPPTPAGRPTETGRQPGLRIRWPIRGAAESRGSVSPVPPGDRTPRRGPPRSSDRRAARASAGRWSRAPAAAGGATALAQPDGAADPGVAGRDGGRGAARRAGGDPAGGRRAGQRAWSWPRCWSSRGSGSAPRWNELAAGYTAAGHGFDLRRAAGGWRLYTRPEYATYVERFVLDGQTVRLTQAALETLAVVAYKQPVTRSRISAIRGVNCDGVIRTLVVPRPGRGVRHRAGQRGVPLPDDHAVPGEAGLNSVDDLPPLAPFLPDDVEELADAHAMTAPPEPTHLRRRRSACRRCSPPPGSAPAGPART